jgi:hypothetical protein
MAAGGVVPGPESTTDLRWITYQNIPANGSSMAIVTQNAPQPENRKSSMCVPPPDPLFGRRAARIAALGVVVANIVPTVAER